MTIIRTARGVEPVLYRLADAGPANVDVSSRTIRYVLSDESVARDGHTIATDGWVLTNFNANPVFGWAHDMSAPPIGKVTSIYKAGKRLMGSVTYADAATYPFADTIFRLVKGGYLNAVSVSWDPIEYKFSTDRNRPGGIDFIRQELLEVSQVPVPALPTALATARAAGIDTRPLYDWAESILDHRRQVPGVDLAKLREWAKSPTPRHAADTSTREGRIAEALALKERHQLELAEISRREARLAAETPTEREDRAERVRIAQKLREQHLIREAATSRQERRGYS